jgi:UDP-N-acetylglucosamine:LPS N-acetylglucosamine transferase
MQTERAPGRIVVVSATIGAGHNVVTRELAHRLRQRGYSVQWHDFMDALPLRMGQRATRGHQAMLRRAPWFYGLLFAIGDRSRFTPPLTRLLLVPARRHIRKLIGADADAVVSTYPLASQVIGSLRRRGELRAPAVTYATDFAVHRHWVAPGIDANLACHPVGAEMAYRYGGRRPRVAGALVNERFRPAAPEEKQAARAALGLPSGRLALVVAGSWGIGELEATAMDIAATGQAIPVVVCGRNDELRQRLIDHGLPYAMGWVEEMATLMQAADVLVENAGGEMALEGMACGLPVISYRSIPGHGTRSAAAQARAGITTWVRNRAELGPVLADVIDGAGGDRQRRAAEVLFANDASACIADLLAEPALAVGGPPPPRTRRTAAVLAGAALGLVALAWAIYSGRSGTGDLLD